jgi:hypothetical protein
MAIMGPSDLPVVLKVDSNPLKFHAISTLGHPNVLIEMQEPQWEQVLRSLGDFIAGYFPKEEKYAYFYSQPLINDYQMPEDAYWIRRVTWDPVSTRIDDIFGAESFLFNIGNISGIQHLLTDYNLLLQYRKFSQRLLGNEGRWEVRGNQTIRLFPTPKGSFPVVVEYLPSVTEFKSPQAREVCFEAILAYTKMTVGYARRKVGNLPGPEGGSLGYDGDALVSEGLKELEEITQRAILLGEPLGIHMH